MRILGNLIWLIFGGLINALLWFIFGLILCVTIIGIPFGTQCFKVANLMLLPFGKKVDLNFFKHPIINVIWVILFGWELALSCLTFGLLFCVTIVGIPFGLQWFKFALLSLFPFGAKVN